MMKFFLILFLVPLSGILLWNHLNAPKPPQFTGNNCIRAMVGEYAKSDYWGMKLMAHAIRNRKTLKGVYGFNAKHIATEPKSVWAMAALAWFESMSEEDPLKGASEWRSQQDIDKKGWPGGFTPYAYYDGTYYLIKEKGGFII